MEKSLSFPAQIGHKARSEVLRTGKRPAHWSPASAVAFCAANRARDGVVSAAASMDYVTRPTSFENKKVRLLRLPGYCSHTKSSIGLIFDHESIHSDANTSNDPSLQRPSTYWVRVASASMTSIWSCPSVSLIRFRISSCALNLASNPSV